MNVLLTGYAGRLGRYVARALKREGHHIRVVLHSHTVLRTSFEEEVDEVLWGSLESPELLDAALKGVQCVVHCAWKFSKQEDPRPSLNERIAEQLIAKSIDERVTRFVFVSSIAVYGMKRPDDKVVTETSPLAEGEELYYVYPSEKIQVERLLQSRSHDGLNLCIFRPGPIFDDFRSPVKKVVQLGRRAFGIGIGNGRNSMPHIHAEDVADAIVRWIGSERSSGVYNITPTTSLRQRQWYRNWGSVKGFRLVPLFVPPLFLRMAAWGASQLFRLLGRKKKINVEYAIACDKRNIVYSNEFARKELQWEPKATERFIR